MLLALISDIHDRTNYLNWALEDMEKRQIDQVLCLGDLVSAFIVSRLCMSTIPVTSIIGNNIGDLAESIRCASKKESNLTFIPDISADFTLPDGQKIFLTHYPHIANIAANSGMYVAIFYGHSHIKDAHIVQGREKKVLVVNPGTLGGIRTNIISYAIVDTQKMIPEEVVFVEK